MIYFDNAATSFKKPQQVKKDVLNAINYYTANPGRSGHKLSQNVATKIFETRELVKEFFNAKEYSVIFTKNCTESLNLAIMGTLKPGDHVITTCYEHNSVLRPLEHLKSFGVQVSILYEDLQCVHEKIEKEIKENTKMVIATMVSNVTGEVCDVERIGEICKKHNLIYLADAAQAVGHMEINLHKTNVDMLAFSGHKGTLSLTGVGVLLVKDLFKLKPIMFGGTGTNSESLEQPSGEIETYESGTLPTISIVSLDSGIRYLTNNFSKILEKEAKLSKYLYKNLKNIKNLTIYSKEESKNVFSFNILNYDSVAVADYLNTQFSISVRAGLHCAPLIHKKLNTLEKGAVRVSLDFNNTYQEIDFLIDCLNKIVSE